MAPRQEREVAAAGLQALDCLAAPVFVLRPDRMIVHANAAGHAALASGRPFQAPAGLLVARRRVDQEVLARALATIWGGQPGVLLPFKSRQGHLSHLLRIAAAPGGALAILVLAELRSRTAVPPGWTMRALQLTTPYADLAEALANGETLVEFAARIGMTHEGARSRLKKLLAMTGTRSQSSLIALVLKTAAVAVEEPAAP